MGWFETTLKVLSKTAEVVKDASAELDKSMNRQATRNLRRDDLTAEQRYRMENLREQTQVRIDARNEKSRSED